MAQTDFTRDAPPKPPIDAPIEQVGNYAATLEKPIRLRVQPDLYNWKAHTYQAWYGLTWYINVADVTEGRKLRKALTDFFVVFGGSEKQQAKLIQALQQLAEGMRG